MADCRAIFEGELDRLLGKPKDTHINDPQWNDVVKVVNTWSDAMSEAGLDPLQTVAVSELGKIDSAMLSRDQRGAKIVTVLDAFIEKHFDELAKTDAADFLRKYRNQSAYVKTKATIEDQAKRISDDAKKNGKEEKTPGQFRTQALLDILSTPEDELKKGLTLEERISSSFAKYFNQLFFNRLYDTFKDLNFEKMMHEPNMIEDTITEFNRDYRDIARNEYLTKNPQAQKVSEILFDTMGQVMTQLRKQGIDIHYQPNMLVPNLNWMKIKAWASKQGGDGKQAFVKFLTPLLHDAHGEETRKMQYAGALWDTMKQNAGYIDWIEISHSVDGVSELRQLFGVPDKTPFMQFKDGDSWQTVSNAFGEHNFFSTVNANLKYLTRLMATTEMFGPDWKINFQRLSREFPELSSEAAQRVQRNSVMRRVNNTFDRMTGPTVVPDNFKYNSALRTARSWEVASKLGSATISSISDLPISGVVMSRLYGVSFFKNIDRIFSGFGESDAKLYAHKLGTATHGMLGALQDRFALFDDSHTANKMQRTANNLSQFVMKVSGMDAWTEGMKAGITSIYRDEIGDYVRAGKNWNQLQPLFSRSLERFGIGEGEWNKLARSEHLDDKGLFDVFALRDEDLRTKISAWFKDTVDHHVLTPSFRDTENAAFRLPPGTVAEEAMRTLSQFKAFPLTYMRKIAGRMFLYSDQSPMSKMATAANFIAAGMLMGVVITQTQQVASGKSPYRFDEPQLYLKAFELASPLGFLTDNFMLVGGDSLFSQLFGENPNHLDAAASFLGPFFGEMLRASDAFTTLAGGEGAKALASMGIIHPQFDVDQRIHSGLSKTSQWILSQMPGQNLWYWKGIYRMLFVDALHNYLDPSGYQHQQSAQWRNAQQRMGNQPNLPVYDELNKNVPWTRH